MKNLKKIEIKYALKSFKLKDDFKISRASKKNIQVIDIFVNINGITGISECVPYSRYNENINDIISYLNNNSQNLEKLIKKQNIIKIPYLCLQNALSSALYDIKLRKKNKILEKKIITAITIPIFNLKKTKKVLTSFKKTKIIKIKLNQEEVIPKLELIKNICPKSQIIIDANESWDIKFLNKNITVLEKFNILLIEQPFAQGKDYLLKKVKTNLQFCADETFHIKNKNLLKQIQYYDAVNLKLDKFGTHHQILKYIKLAQKYKKKIMLGCMVCSSLSIYPTIQYFKYCDYFDLDGAYFLKKDRLNGIKYKNGIAKITLACSKKKGL